MLHLSMPDQNDMNRVLPESTESKRLRTIRDDMHHAMAVQAGLGGPVEVLVIRFSESSDSAAD